MQIILRSACAALALAACWQAGAATDEEPPGLTAPLTTMAPVEQGGGRALPVMVPSVVIRVADPAGFDSKAVSAERLARLRGGTDTVSNDMQLNGAVSGNSAVNVFTGSNTIGQGSFSNASGLPVAIQNSGANVLIQNATIINIQMQ
jgi:hypothetical protein